MSPEDIKALRKGLRCTAKELALELQIDPNLVRDWEQGERFPTKRDVERMRALGEAGATLARNQRKSQPGAPGPYSLLADEKLWCVVRKLLAHPEFMQRVHSLAEEYDDPAGTHG